MMRVPATRGPLVRETVPRIRGPYAGEAFGETGSQRREGAEEFWMMRVPTTRGPLVWGDGVAKARRTLDDAGAAHCVDSQEMTELIRTARPEERRRHTSQPKPLRASAPL